MLSFCYPNLNVINKKMKYDIMTDSALKFIQNYENNNSIYDNGYLLYNPGYFKNKAWFRFNIKKNDWEWSNDLIYWNKKYDMNIKSSVWINRLLDNKNDINNIISYLRLSRINKNILQMNDPIQRISAYIDQLYNLTLNTQNNKISNHEINLNVIHSTIKNVKEETDKIKNVNLLHNNNSDIYQINSQVMIDKDTLNNLNNTIQHLNYTVGNLNRDIISYKSEIQKLSNYFVNINNDFDTINSELCDSFLIYQSSILSELDVNPSDTITENTNLIFNKVNILNKKLDELINENSQLKEQLDEQIFEKSLCEKRINGTRCTIKSLEISNMKLQQSIDSLKKEKKTHILEIEGYKNTIEGNTMKIFGITQELEKKNNIIHNLIQEKTNSSLFNKSGNINLEQDNTNLDDFEILSSDEIF